MGKMDYNSEKKSKRAYEISVLSMEGDSLTDEKRITIIKEFTTKADETKLL